MIYDTYRQEENYWVLTKDKNKFFIPAAHMILVDDESGLKAVKSTATRKTIALVKGNEKEER